MDIEVNGLRLHVLDEGGGEPVLLLHGFPDSGRLWRHQVPALTAAGFRAIAPDLRGFGESDRPEGVDSYGMQLIVGDVLGVLDAAGIERANVVGHDWGAAVGWALAAMAPSRVSRLVALTVGHPAGFFTDAMGQRERSWYMLFFQHAGVAEDALRRDDWWLFRQWARGQGDLDVYIRDLDRPGALTAALNWYRANTPAEAFGVVNPIPLPPVSRPVLGVWAAQDHFLGEAQMLASEAHCQAGWRYERIEAAGHWLPLDAPDELNRLVLGFLAEDSGAGAG
jgi:pimeloyl-ACP methyl ester carboxylesterase